MPNTSPTPRNLFYLQIEGQPVDKAAWSQINPFDQVIKNQAGIEIPWTEIEKNRKQIREHKGLIITNTKQFEIFKNTNRLIWFCFDTI